LNEVLIALVILGIIGAAFTKLLATQNRFFDQQTNKRAARGIARNSMNVLMSDLRMLQDSLGVDSISTDGRVIRVRVPYRFGLFCGNSGSVSTVSVLPIDSGTFATAAYAGWAYRSPT